MSRLTRCTPLALLLFASGVSVKAQTPAGLNLWLRGDDAIAGTGGAVSFWADQSGKGHDAIQPNSTFKPVRIDNLLNGHAALRFDGNNDFFALAGQVLTSQQFTIMSVVNDKRMSGDRSFREIFSNWSGSNSVTSVFFGTTDNDNSNDPIRARLTDDFGGATDPLNPQTGRGSIVHPASHFIFSGIASASDTQVYQGSSLLASKGSPLSTHNLIDPYTIGKQGSGNFEYWFGDMAEVLVYNRALTSAEFGANVAYLQTKYFGAAQVPEPGALAFLAGGISGALLISRRRRK